MNSKIITDNESSFNNGCGVGENNGSISQIVFQNQRRRQQVSNDDASRNQPIAAPDDIDIEISFQDSDLNLDDDSDQYVANDT